MKKTIFLLMLAVLLPCFISCGSDSNEEETPTTKLNPIIGKWLNFEGINTLAGAYTYLTFNKDLSFDCTVIHKYEDGTEEGRRSKKGTWTTTPGVFTIKYNTGSSESISYTIVGDTMRCTWMQDGSVFVRVTE